MIRVLAIDDEPLALKQLEMYIAKVPYLELVAACHSALEARRVLSEQAVDAMFLDINMPDITGMDFVRTLTNPPLVVFTTEYSEFAVEGFRVNAVDYLLKPFGLADFLAAAEKLRERLAPREAAAAPAPAAVSPQDDALFFKTDYRTVRVRIRDIRYVEGMSEYAKVWLTDSPTPLIVLVRLKALEDRLPAGRFMRVHRSYIISLEHIREVSRKGITLDDGTLIPVGDSYRQDVKDYLSRTSLG